MLNSGQVFEKEIGIHVTMILGFQYRALTQLKYQWFGIGTPIHQSLI